jgi:hypothetical protein
MLSKMQKASLAWATGTCLAWMCFGCIHVEITLGVSKDLPVAATVQLLHCADQRARGIQGKEDLSSVDARIARESLRDAFKDAKGLFDVGHRNMPRLQQRLVLVVEKRIQTFRDALAEFVAGYNQGTHEV